jgi:hypothetical protein
MTTYTTLILQSTDGQTIDFDIQMCQASGFLRKHVEQLELIEETAGSEVPQLSNAIKVPLTAKYLALVVEYLFHNHQH